MLSTAGNAYATLMAGFTTIQSPGSPEDNDLREWIALGQIPGPRVLTSLSPFSNARLSPDSLRAIVRAAQSARARTSSRSSRRRAFATAARRR